MHGPFHSGFGFVNGQKRQKSFQLPHSSNLWTQWTKRLIEPKRERARVKEVNNAGALRRAQVTLNVH